MGKVLWISVLLLAVASCTPVNQVCTDEECKKISAEYLANMDTTVNPCDDFYKFACGKYAGRHPIADDRVFVDRMTEVSDKLELQLKEALEEPIQTGDPKHIVNAKKYYKSCIDTETIEKIGLSEAKKLIDSMGGWPVVKDKNPGANWETVLYALRDYGFKAHYLLHMYKDIDFINNNVRIFGINRPQLNFDHAYLIKGRDDEIVKAYYQFMVNMAKLFGATEEKAKKDMGEALDFQITMAKSMKTIKEQSADFNSLYNVYDINTLKTNFSGFPWNDYLEHFLPEGFKVPKTMKVVVQEPRYVNDLIKLLDKTEQRIVRNYLVWQGVYDMMLYLNQETRDVVQEYSNTLSGQSKPQPRFSECIIHVKQQIPTVVSSLFIKKYFNQKAKSVASDMLVDVQAEFANVLKETDWPAEDKENAIEKINNFYAHVAYPVEMTDDKVLGDLYDEIEVDESNFLKSSVNLENAMYEIDLKQIFLPVNRTSWLGFASPATINAFYQADQNLIQLPAAILQGAYFNENRPKYANYAAIGAVIAHEMSHGFDDTGSQFDKDGNLRKWLSDAGVANFKNKQQCLIDQYNQFSIHGQKLNGALEVGENVADFGGFKVAYRSYRKWEKKNGSEPGLPGLNFTNHQLFWIASANVWCDNVRPKFAMDRLQVDAHAPNQFRVNGAFGNLDSFSEDFNCPAGSGMNPLKKCTPW